MTEEVSKTTKNVMKFFAVLFAFMYVVTTSTSNIFSGMGLSFKSIVANIFVRFTILLPVTIFGGLISAMLEGAFTGFTFLGMSVGNILKFIIYAILLYYYFYIVAVAIKSYFKK